MKKIAVIENNFTATVTIRRALMYALADRGYEVIILSYGLTEFSAQLKDLPATCVEIGTSNTNPVEVLKYMRRLYRALKSAKPDICLTFTPRQNIYGNLACKRLGIPVLSNITGTGVPFHIKGMIYAAGRLMYRFVLKLPRIVFFQNTDDMDHLIAKGYVKRSRAVLIPGSGIETEKFLPVEKPAGGPFVFLFIGRLVKIKGIEELVKAARSILSSGVECEFWIVGPLWKQNTGKLTVTREEINLWEHKGIIFKGETKDVRPFIAACDCFVLPSYREGLSNSILEAASMERPVVTTDVTGCRDVVTDQVNGLLCKPGDAESLESALLNMYNLSAEQRKEMGRQGRVKVKAAFEKSVVIQKYLDQIQNII